MQIVNTPQVFSAIAQGQHLTVMPQIQIAPEYAQVYQQGIITVDPYMLAEAYNQVQYAGVGTYQYMRTPVETVPHVMEMITTLDVTHQWYQTHGQLEGWGWEDYSVPRFMTKEQQATHAMVMEGTYWEDAVSDPYAGCTVYVQDERTRAAYTLTPELQRSYLDAVRYAHVLAEQGVDPTTSNWLVLDDEEDTTPVATTAKSADKPKVASTATTTKPIEVPRFAV